MTHLFKIGDLVCVNPQPNESIIPLYEILGKGFELNKIYRIVRIDGNLLHIDIDGWNRSGWDSGRFLPFTIASEEKLLMTDKSNIYDLLGI